MDMTKINDVLSFEDSYANLILIMNAIDDYFMKIKVKGQIKFLPEIIWKDMVNINNLISGSRIDVQNLVKIVLVIVSTTDNKDNYFDKLSEGKEKYLDGYLDIIQKYIDLSEEQSTETMEQFKRRFTTRTSVLFASKDPVIIFNCIDNLRKKIDDLQHEKEGLLKANTKAEAEKKEFSHQIEIFQSTISMYQYREEELKNEINDIKRSNQLIPDDHTIIKNELLLIEKTQEFRQLEEASTLKISALNHKITQLQNENLDLVMMNEQSIQMHQDNSQLKEEIIKLKKEIYELNRLKEEEKIPLSNEIYKHKERISELEKENASYQSKVVALKNDLSEKNQNEETQNKFIILLESKHKELEKKYNAVLSRNSISSLIIDDSQTKELLSSIESKEKKISEMQQEIDKLKIEYETSQNQVNIQYKDKIVTKTEIVTKIVKQFDTLYKVKCDQREFIHTSSIASKEKLSKEIMKGREELRKRDRDIEFLKKAYTELKTKSEEEYNMVSSSLYELALHLTKIKAEINNNNHSNGSHHNNFTGFIN